MHLHDTLLNALLNVLLIKKDLIYECPYDAYVINLRDDIKKSVEDSKQQPNLSNLVFESQVRFGQIWPNRTLTG